jgi:valyl-tRNA synthetase
MSKTKGNVMDPIEIIERYGTDAVRFTMAAMVAPGGDIAFSESRTESYRAFANKIWNAARFLFMNVDRATEAGLWSLAEFKAGQNLDSGAGAPPFREGEGGSKGVHGFKSETLEDRWILSRFNRVAQEIHDALDIYRFHEAAHVVYHFFWGEFCDWYLELIKPRLMSDDREAARVAYANLIGIFEGALRLLSPFMPFITEELWHAVYDGQPPAKSIALSRYPLADPAQMDADAETAMAILQDLIVSVRNIRAELKVEPKQKVAIEVFAAGEEVRSMLERNRSAVERLANVDAITFVEESLAKASGARSTARFDIRVLFERKIDVAAERDRLTKELEKLTLELARGTAQLNNEAFLSKAPAKVVDGLKRRKAEVEMLIEKIKTALDELR